MDADKKLKITADLNIAMAAELRDVLLAQLERGSEIVLDLSETPGMRCGGVSDSFSAGQKRGGANRVCRIDAISEPVKKRADVLGIRFEEPTAGGDREL